MSTIKNGAIGTIDTTTGELPWDEGKDKLYLQENRDGMGVGEDSRKHLIESVQNGWVRLQKELDHAISFLWRQSHTLDRNLLPCLSVTGRVQVLRQLTIQYGNGLTSADKQKYLWSLGRDLTRCEEAESIRNRVLARYLLDPHGTWLRELVELDDSITWAWYELQESMTWFHDGYVDPYSLSESRHHRLE